MALQKSSARSISSTRKRFILALLAGVLAALMMYFYASNLQTQANAAQNAAIEAYGGEKTEVLVATRNILAGEELSADNAVMMPWLSNLLPQGAITIPDEAYGRTVSIPVWANEPLLAAKLGDGEELVFVPDGLTAVCIPISDDMAIGGSMLPGSSVDVYAIEASIVRLVIADVLVLEASNGLLGSQASDAGDTSVVLGGSSRASLKWVTLAVQDETIPELLSAARDSKLSLVLPGQNAGGALRELLNPAEQQSTSSNQEGEQVR